MSAGCICLRTIPTLCAHVVYLCMHARKCTSVNALLWGRSNRRALGVHMSGMPALFLAVKMYARATLMVDVRLCICMLGEPGLRFCTLIAIPVHLHPLREAVMYMPVNKRMLAYVRELLPSSTLLQHMPTRGYPRILLN